MNDKVKLCLQITRKNLLLLNKRIQRRLSGRDGDDKSMNIADVIGGDSLPELNEVAHELLNKAGLTAMNQKLQAF